MERRPTKKQQELLNFIDGFIKGNGYGPSYREIMRALDYKSVSTVAVHVDGLIARGWLMKKDHSARTLELAVPMPASVGSTACQEIDRKLIELRADKISNAEAIVTLENTLKLLGYTKE